jgi:hypothetical protein
MAIEASRLARGATMPAGVFYGRLALFRVAFAFIGCAPGLGMFAAGRTASSAAIAFSVGSGICTVSPGFGTTSVCRNFYGGCCWLCRFALSAFVLLFAEHFAAIPLQGC